MSWQKEKQEHPWTTKKQAKQIAKDHAKKKTHRHSPHQSIPALKTAAQDAKHLEVGFHRITYSKHELGR